MTDIPRDPAWDSTLAFLTEGYTFVSAHCRRLRSDRFATRLMLRPAVCALGEDAARMFYAPDRFTRRGGLPITTLMALQDFNSVQVMDGEAFRQRKQMFLSIMTESNIERLADLMELHWRAALPRWRGRDRIVLYVELHEILTRAACEWAGVPLPEAGVGQRARELEAMVTGAGSAGPRNWWGLLVRRRTEAWLQRLITRVRAGDVQAPEGSAAHVVTWHRDQAGKLLAPEVAALELLNFVRPTVAVARFITFAALALHDYPAARPRPGATDGELECFVHEVRRFYPFVPVIGGRARVPFDWDGHHFAEGAWVLLDAYGTNHDPRLWNAPDEFQPERFRDWTGNPFTFLSQGGGGHHTGHRCPGEWIVIALMARAVRLLTSAMTYEVPPQDLGVDLSTFLVVPTSRVVMANVRERDAA